MSNRTGLARRLGMSKQAARYGQVRDPFGVVDLLDAPVTS
jgi:hypothetical protein